MERYELAVLAALQWQPRENVPQELWDEIKAAWAALSEEEKALLAK